MTVVLKPNLPLFDRALVEAGDLQAASLTLTVAPAPKGMADELASSKVEGGAVVNLAEQSGLQAVRLSPDNPLALTLWRHQFHYHGGGELRDLRIVRVSDGKSVSLPQFKDKPVAETELGTFRLTGQAKRGRFPIIEKQGEVQAGDNPGTWTVEDARGVSMTAGDGTLGFHTNGQANFNDDYSWAPVLVFEPKQAGAYNIRGELHITSGQPADKNDPRTMTWMATRLATDDAKPARSNLLVYRLLRPFDPGSGSPVAGEDVAPEAVASVTLDQVLNNQRQTIELARLSGVVSQWLQSRDAAHGLLLAVESQDDGGTPPRVVLLNQQVKGSIAVTDRPSHRLFEHDVRPTEGVYTVMRDGKLYYGDQRLRLWGVVGFPSADRLMKMGFNAQRIWEPRAQWMYDDESARRGEIKPYTKGDGSRWDRADKHLADLKQAGGFVMLGALTGTLPLKPLLADDSFIAGGDDWQQWKGAMSQNNPDHTRWIFFDERLQAIRKRHAENLLTWVNPYTGKAYGQEEAIATYEVFNENGAPKRLLEGSYEKWPAYFKDKFESRWNDWLKARYGDDAGLKAAWGELKDGESLKKGTVALGPTFQQRNDFPEQRGSDFVRFVIELVDAFNQEFRAYCRTLAPQGVGVNVVPFSFDTQYRPNLAWTYIQSRGDVNCPGMYFWNLESSLAKPPSAYMLDNHTVEGTATILYETNAGRPGKHRAEYPLKLAALANWQDWDGVFWHYWSPGPGESDEAYLTAAMPYTSPSHYWTAVQHQSDPVMTASMAAAGRMFLGYQVKPAADPDVIEVGEDAIVSYSHYNGIGQAQRTFSEGSRMKFQPDRDTGVSIDGKPHPQSQRMTQAVQAGDEITWDWPHGRLIVDTPYVKGYAGRIDGPYRFKGDIVLGEVNTPSVVFYLISADGRPLLGDDPAKRVYVTAMADAHNTGFEMDWSVKGGPLEQAKAQKDWGRAPVVVDQVAFKVWFPTQLNATFNVYDFALRQRVDQPVSGANQVAHDGENLWMATLDIQSRGPAADVPDVQTADVDRTEAQSTDQAPAAQAAGGPWNPIPSLSWNLDYHAAHQTLRDGAYVFTSISKEDFSVEARKTIEMSDAELATLWNALADIEFTFNDNRMTNITVTFKQPPPLADVMGAYEVQFGAPAEKKLGAQYESSTARWPATADRPAILITEAQGILKILYDVAR